MKKIHNSNSLREVRSILDSAILYYHSADLCYHIQARRKPSPCGKNIAACQGSANSVNISLKFEVNSTLILPVKCPLTKLEQSQCYKLTFSSINERTKAFLNAKVVRNEWSTVNPDVVNALPNFFSCTLLISDSLTSREI